MKILHTADWHIGKKLDHYARLDEQKLVLNEICEIADREAVDCVVIAGDLFDNFSPSSEATELLYSTLHCLSANGARAIIAIAGNHDSPERIEVPDAMARACGIIFVGFPNAEVKLFRTQAGVEVVKVDKGFVEIKLPKVDFPLRLLLTPYANEQRLKTFLGLEDTEEALRLHLQAHWQQIADRYLDDAGFNLLVTHLYMMRKGGDMPEEPDDERPILNIGGAQAVFSENIPAQIHYTALGHLHRYQVVDKVPCPVVYSSSPLGYSFSESNQTKYVVILEAEAGKLVSYRPVELKQGKKLHRARFENVDDALTWLQAHRDNLVQITMVTETYLESADKKRLMDAHPALMAIIPEIRTKEAKAEAAERLRLDPDKLSIEDLFIDYFKNSTVGKGQLPGESLLDLFREVRALDEAEES